MLIALLVGIQLLANVTPVPEVILGQNVAEMNVEWMTNAHLGCHAEVVLARTHVLVLVPKERYVQWFVTHPYVNVLEEPKEIPKSNADKVKSAY